MSGDDIVSVDPATGNRTIVSGASRGSGEQLGAVGFSIVGTDLYVANESLYDIVKVDTLTGNRTVVSSASVGTGPGLTGQSIPFDVELDHSGNLLAIVVYANNSSSSTAILSIDPSTGNRTLLSGLGVGTGPDLPEGFAGVLAVAADGTLYTNHDVAASFTFQGPVLRIDPATGNRTIVSDATHGTGPLFAPTPALMVVPNVPEPSTIVLAVLGVAMLMVRRCRRSASLAVVLIAALAAAPSIQAAGLAPGDIVVGAAFTDSDFGLMLVDPVTGNRTILSDNTHGTGPVLSEVSGITFASDGSLLVGDAVAQQLVRIDPITGNRTVISSGSIGTGPTNGFYGARQFGSELVLTGGDC